MNIYTLREDGMMHDNKLFARSLAPKVQNTKEFMPFNLLTIDDCTSLAGDIHPRITSVFELITEIRLLYQVGDLSCAPSANKNLVQGVIINRPQQVFAVGEFVITLWQFLKNNFWWENVTLTNKLWGRDIADDVTIDLLIIHPWFEGRM